jgi:hypothetical protein
MKLKNQVCTIEQAKRLMELGIVQDRSIEQFVPSSHLLFSAQRLVSNDENWYAAFTVAELGVMLPDEYIKHFDFPGDKTPKSGKYLQQFNAWFFPDVVSGRKFGVRFDFDGNINIATPSFFGTEAEARAGLIIYLLENNLTTPDEVNQRLIAA